MQIPKDTTARNYEVTFLVPASFTETERAEVVDSVSALVAKHQGMVTETQDWGKKSLAYSIAYKSKPQREAFFSHLLVSLLPDQAQQFERELYLSDKIMRHLVIKAV